MTHHSPRADERPPEPLPALAGLTVDNIAPRHSRSIRRGRSAGRPTASSEDSALRAMAWAAEYDRAKTIHDQRVAVVVAGFSRAQSAAEFVRNAAAGVLAIDQMILGLAFVARDKPLPAIGVLSPSYLALALVAATIFAAWLSPGATVAAPLPGLSLETYQERRLGVFSAWIRRSVLRRAYFLHVAVTCLGLRALTLPLPMLDVGSEFSDLRFVAILLAAGLAVGVGGPLMPAAISRVGQRWPRRRGRAEERVG